MPSTLLCIDDEEGVLHALKRLLRKEPFRVLTATSGEEALALMAQHPIQVVLSDQRMPGMTGAALLKQIRIRYPSTIRVMLSGYAEVHALVAAINEGEIYRFVPKPWVDDDLKALLRQCFTRQALAQQQRDLIMQARKACQSQRAATLRP